MKRERGRPRNVEYRRIQSRFIEMLIERLKAAGKTKTWLYKNAVIHKDGKPRLVNKRHASGIVSGQRVPTLGELYAFMDAAGFGPDLEAEFAWAPRPFWWSAESKLIGNYNYPRPELLEPVTLLVQEFYIPAYRKLRLILDSAVETGDVVLEADAAARMAWLLLESGEFRGAEEYVIRSIKKAAQVLKMPVADILRSAEPLRASDHSSTAAIALRILSDAQHLRSQILVSRMLYLEEDGLEQSARRALADNLELDRRLALREPMGNALRWAALMEVAVTGDREAAANSIEKARDMFDHDGLYEAHLINANGVVALETGGDPRLVRRLLIEAQERLTLTADARGLALNLNSLSEAPQRPSANKDKPFRYLLSAAALYPYSFLVERFRNQARLEPRLLQAEIDRLLAGNEEYRSVHQMMARLAQGSTHTGEDLLYRNIELMLADEFLKVKLPFRRAVLLDQ